MSDSVGRNLSAFLRDMPAATREFAEQLLREGGREGGPCKNCAPGSVSIEWNCPQCGGTGIDPDEKVLKDGAPK